MFLSADILQGPNADTSDNKPIDPQRFLRLCNSLYPQSTLSLGWTTGPAAPGGTNRYDWASVKSMHDLVERWDLKQTLTFPVRATYVKKSIPQLKWLTEMTGGSLTVWSPRDDEVPVADLLLLRYRFPKHSLFYDLHSGLHAEFQPVKEEAELKLSVEDKDIESSIFRADKWKVVKTQGGEVIYLGNEAVLLQKGLLVTKEMYMSPFSLSGRVEFLPQDHDGDADATSSEPGIEIFVLVTQSSRPDTLSGIKCFIGASGTLRLSTQGIPGIDRKVEGYVLGHTACYSFKLSNQDESHLTMNVFRQTECGVRGTTDDREGLLQLSLADIAQSASHIAVHSSTGKGFVAVDQFNIQ